MELHYFDFEGGRGNYCRIPLHASSLEWKDVRLKGPEFGAAKAEGKYPTGLPILKLPSGRIITQSSAIARYAGKHCDNGLYPKDPEAALVVDELLDTVQDMFTKIPNDKDEKLKKEKREEFAGGRLKEYMEILTESCKQNGGPYVSGKTVTIADIAVEGLVNYILSGNVDFVPASYLEDWPEVVKASALVKDSDVVKAYNASRK